jgi:ABC-type multidrug transport system ATPase subunit/ABC-type multidrug transport system permease subunit
VRNTHRLSPLQSCSRTRPLPAPTKEQHVSAQHEVRPRSERQAVSVHEPQVLRTDVELPVATGLTGELGMTLDVEDSGPARTSASRDHTEAMPWSQAAPRILGGRGVSGREGVDREAGWGGADGCCGGGLEAHRVGLVLDDRALLTDVSFAAGPGTVTAVIGPSGAGKSTLINLLGGASAPSVGLVRFDGHHLHGEYAWLRSRIGVVPQDDVVHRQLTVGQALGYAAELRLPAATAAQRDRVVARVLDELELTPYRRQRVDTLSGGQRKRASVAMELLTGPSLLILDEPTSGLDPALDRQVMLMLRRLADAGRVVVVVTHSLTYLHMCDQVLLLAAGGKPAYAGPPAQIAAAMGTADWADIFAWVSTDPDAAHGAFLARNTGDGPPARPAPAPAGPARRLARTGRGRQVWTVARRQVRLIVADRCYLVSLTVLPFILGVLALVVPGQAGLGPVHPRAANPNEPSQILVLLSIAAVFMGTALSIRDLVAERSIFRRERAVGLSASAYLLAKTLIYSAVAAGQVAVLTAIVLAGKGGPAAGAVLVGNSVVELYLALAATAIVSAVGGLGLSALAKSGEQILPMLVVAIMVSIVFCGGLIPVTGRPGLDQVSWLLPARWGFAAAAATVDLRTIDPLAPAGEVLWTHSSHRWLFNLAVLGMLGAAVLVFVRYRLRLPRGAKSVRINYWRGWLGRPGAAPPTPATPPSPAGGTRGVSMSDQAVHSATRVTGSPTRHRAALRPRWLAARRGTPAGRGSAAAGAVGTPSPTTVEHR